MTKHDLFYSIVRSVVGLRDIRDEIEVFTALVEADDNKMRTHGNSLNVDEIINIIEGYNK